MCAYEHCKHDEPPCCKCTKLYDNGERDYFTPKNLKVDPLVKCCICNFEDYAEDQDPCQYCKWINTVDCWTPKV